MTPEGIKDLIFNLVRLQPVSCRFSARGPDPKTTSLCQRQTLDFLYYILNVKEQTKRQMNNKLFTKQSNLSERLSQSQHVFLGTKLWIKSVPNYDLSTLGMVGTLGA